MDNLSFHITDITANSIRAKATDIEIDIQDINQMIILRITDNGCGMDTEIIDKIRNPFYTTRTMRKIGLGLPFLIQNTEQTGGNVEIRSSPGKGTSVVARFITSNIDCPPWGDLAGTVAMLIGGNPEINIHFSYLSNKVSFDISTNEIKEVLDDMPLSHPQVIQYLKDVLSENLTI